MRAVERGAALFHATKEKGGSRLRNALRAPGMRANPTPPAYYSLNASLSGNDYFWYLPDDGDDGYEAHTEHAAGPRVGGRGLGGMVVARAARPIQILDMGFRGKETLEETLDRANPCWLKGTGFSRNLGMADLGIESDHVKMVLAAMRGCAGFLAFAAPDKAVSAARKIDEFLRTDQLIGKCEGSLTSRAPELVLHSMSAISPCEFVPGEMVIANFFERVLNSVVLLGDAKPFPEIALRNATAADLAVEDRTAKRPAPDDPGSDSGSDSGPDSDYMAVSESEDDDEVAEAVDAGERRLLPSALRRAAKSIMRKMRLRRKAPRQAHQARMAQVAIVCL